MTMKKFGTECLDCGSEAIMTIVDEIKPLFRIEIVEFACGAVLKSTFCANGSIAKAAHKGCTHIHLVGFGGLGG
jgi:hypothetical protein